MLSENSNQIPTSWKKCKFSPLLWTPKTRFTFFFYGLAKLTINHKTIRVRMDSENYRHTYIKNINNYSPACISFYGLGKFHKWYFIIFHKTDISVFMTVSHINFINFCAHVMTSKKSNSHTRYDLPKIFNSGKIALLNVVSTRIIISEIPTFKLTYRFPFYGVRKLFPRTCVWSPIIRYKKPQPI